MADETLFAPAPLRVRFVLRDRTVPTELYRWIDLPVKDAATVHALENELRDGAPGWHETTVALQKIVRLFCPALAPADLEALSMAQLQAAIATAYGPAPDPPAAEAGAASPSPSAASITRSPGSTTGAPTPSAA